jgi:branched-chain amino acid transport system ATP-binding protein
MTLSAQDLSVCFGGLQALAEVSLEVTPGRILGLIGPNGAGKTTLFNCLTGVIQPKGTVVVDGVEITQLRTDERVLSAPL